MGKTIVFATNNVHKLEEIRRITNGVCEILSLADIGCHDDIPETADTIEGNALLKCRYVRDRYGYDCFADDTGLEVEALGGEPGVHSARYAPGDGHDSVANMALLLHNLEGVDNRRARFRTVIALTLGGREYMFEGVAAGHISKEAAGNGGFGYDPVFFSDDLGKTFAEATADEKNSISHRGRATKALLDFLANKNYCE